MSAATLRIRKAKRREYRRVVRLVGDLLDDAEMEPRRPYTLGALEAASWIGVVLAGLVLGAMVASLGGC